MDKTDDEEDRGTMKTIIHKHIHARHKWWHWWGSWSVVKGTVIEECTRCPSWRVKLRTRRGTSLRQFMKFIGGKPEQAKIKLKRPSEQLKREALDPECFEDFAQLAGLKGKEREAAKKGWDGYETWARKNARKGNQYDDILTIEDMYETKYGPRAFAESALKELGPGYEIEVDTGARWLRVENTVSGKVDFVAFDSMELAAWPRLISTLKTVVGH